MEVVLFEDENWKRFLPLVFTRPIGEMRIGIYKISEKWEKSLNCPVTHRTRPYLRSLFPITSQKDVLLINARFLPTSELVEALENLQDGEALVHQNRLVAMKASVESDLTFEKSKTYSGDVFELNNITDLFTYNERAIKLDAPLWSKENTHQDIPEGVTIIGDRHQVFIEHTATVLPCIINVNAGPVIIDAHAEVMEGALIRGGLYLGEHSQIKMGSKIYGAVTIGPHCKVGGEVTNSLLQGFSNKSHDGYLGNSVLGEWCNLGADTNNSNLKNNYSDVQIWNYETHQLKSTGLTFCGLLMGDHSKSGINTMFNTGTTVGVASNIFGGGFPDKYIPNFSWGGASGWETHQLDKAISTTKKVMARRSLEVSEEYEKMLEHIFNMPQQF
ncbi:MAG: GlmU family protein [Flavobacteriales bacterium]